MNTSLVESVEVEDESYVILAALTAAVGGVIFFTNACLLSFIIKLMHYGHLKRDKYGTIIHTFFVCLWDTFSGFILLLTGLIKANSYISTFICANLIFLCFASQIVAQGNITCICAQRYILSRSLRRTTTNWSSAYTKSLAVVNIIIGVASLATYIVDTKVKYDPNINHSCKLSSVSEAKSGFIASINFLLGVLCIIAANILSLLTVRKLRTKVDIIEVKSANEPVTLFSRLEVSMNNTCQTGSSVTNSTRSRQNKATVTLLLILLSFNISQIPFILTYILMIIGINTPQLVQRPVLLSLFMNSIANPLIIVTRVENVKSSVKETVCNVWAKMKYFLSR